MPDPRAMPASRARNGAPIVVASIVILWTGKLLPHVGDDHLDAALGALVILLSLWLVVLSRTAWRGDRNPLRGWRVRDLALGVALGAAGFILAGLGYVVSSRVAGLPPPAQASLAGAGGLRLFLVGGIGVAAAVLEEWIFRGWIFDRLSRALSRGTVPLSALVFAAYHLSLFQLLPTFLLGLVLAASVARAGSLRPAVVAHVLFNVAGILLGAAAPPS